MRHEIFKYLVDIAFQRSKSDYCGQMLPKPNPFYIGFGNPDANLLIIGQEKAIDSNKDAGKRQMELESTCNPCQWMELMKNNITDIDYKFDKEAIFKNPRFPYDGKPLRGNTWNQYQQLVTRLFPDMDKRPNSFLLEAFITELNHSVSPTKLGNERNPERVSFMSHDFYKSFPMTIIAAGNYLEEDEIENQFDVKFVKNISAPHRKLVVYENSVHKRILINTRQFSNFFFGRVKRDNYFDDIIRELTRFND